jgi:hypothetical protein
MSKPKQFSRMVTIEFTHNDKYKLKRMSVAQIIELGKVIEDLTTNNVFYDVEYLTPVHAEGMALNLTGDDDENI